MTSAPPSGPGRGRRAGAGDTRGDILTAARASFGGKGYAGTSIRAVAASAGVDPALVHHYFGTKDDLFVAALALPLDLREKIAEVAAGDRDSIGPRVVETFLSVWDHPEYNLSMVAVVRSGLTGEPGRGILEAAMQRLIFGVLADALRLDDAERRLGLVASQMMGLIVTRYVLALEPVASMPGEELVRAVGPTVQRYLTGPLA